MRKDLKFTPSIGVVSLCTKARIEPMHGASISGVRPNIFRAYLTADLNMPASRWHRLALYCHQLLCEQLHLANTWSVITRIKNTSLEKGTPLEKEYKNELRPPAWMPHWLYIRNRKTGEYRLNKINPSFWDKVNLISPDDCWEWTAGLDKQGYGRFRIGDYRVKAHQYAYGLLIHPLPDILVLVHDCFNLKCVNPTHMSFISYYEYWRLEDKARSDQMKLKPRKPREPGNRRKPRKPKNK